MSFELNNKEHIKVFITSIGFLLKESEIILMRFHKGGVSFRNINDAEIYQEIYFRKEFFDMFGRNEQKFEQLYDYELNLSLLDHLNNISDINSLMFVLNYEPSMDESVGSQVLKLTKLIEF
jgi:hypothetical protein